MQNPEIDTLYQQANIHVGELADSLAELVKDALPAPHDIVCDVNTHAALGHKISGFSTYIFDAPPEASMENVQKLRRETIDAASLIAVGSGTLNDLCKYASFLDGKPYAVAATAPSMNGYVSANASISEGGYKNTLPAHAPKAVWCDLPTLANAPKRLIHAGIGDTLCRSTVQVDWLLSHLLTESAYEEKYFRWLQPYEDTLIEESGVWNLESSGSNSKLQTPATHLAHALLISGLAMRDFGSSAPASQGEHMIAHALEMLYPDLPHPYHGEAIAVTSLVMARHQAAILSRETAPKIRYTQAEDFSAYLPEALIPQARMHYSRKFPNARYVERLNKDLQENWSQIRDKLRKDHLPPERLETALKKAGCLTTPQQISWTEEALSHAIQAAPLTRDRFTFLDLE